MKTYTNPVSDRYMADPFVLSHKGHYYAYGTGPAVEDRQFPILHSIDLVTWEPKGAALIPAVGDEFWAPEVAYNAGTFYLYYSAHGVDGNDHQLRVATSADPLGPFVDAGKVLVTDQPFSIDPHPFQDRDGQWYLFYCRDFLTLDEDYRVGTGIAVDRMLDMTTLAGNPQTVIRPHADWHLFMARRPMYGNVYDWHTIEGAAVRVHNGHYYCFYSGGAWERENYGISYVAADHPLGPYTRPAEAQEAILRSMPNHVIGPGHNSFALSPDKSEEFVIYHAWNPEKTDRLMRIDRLTWEGDVPIIHGPTYTPQPTPSE